MNADKRRCFRGHSSAIRTCLAQPPSEPFRNSERRCRRTRFPVNFASRGSIRSGTGSTPGSRSRAVTQGHRGGLETGRTWCCRAANATRRSSAWSWIRVVPCGPIFPRYSVSWRASARRPGWNRCASRNATATSRWMKSSCSSSFAITGSPDSPAGKAVRSESTSPRPRNRPRATGRRTNLKSLPKPSPKRTRPRVPSLAAATKSSLAARPNCPSLPVIRSIAVGSTVEATQSAYDSGTGWTPPSRKN